MLIELDIENIAVIERASIEFDNGLNVITGETGSGKSLLINSINMALGKRTPHDLIREGADFSKVSAVFFSSEIDSFLTEAGVDTDNGNVIISRKLYRDGRNVCHINGCAVNVSLLRSIGEKLVVIHGQHDTGELMSSSSHINFLDAFSKNGLVLENYRDTFLKLKEARKNLKKLNTDEDERKREIDYLSYQIKEIEEAELSIDEEQELLQRKTILENSGEISLLSQKAYAALSDSGAKSFLYDAMKAIEKLSTIDETASQYSENISELYYEVEELARDLSAYTSRIEYNPNELEKINDRLDTINTLKRKFGGEIEDILKFYTDASEKLSFLNSFNENKAELEKTISLLTKKAYVLAEEITASRIQSAALLSEKLTEELENLDMPKCKISFQFTPSELYENGAEYAELLISTNPLEAPKPLSKIASGGELSRVMLAIKSVFSDFDKIPTLLFDEIDTGVSGRAAEKIGRKMKNLSLNYQLICVTHLPVIAASAKNHILIEKTDTTQGFKTQIKTLSHEERIYEIARIISGDSISNISLENAAELLKENS